jgi:heme-binding protein
MDVSPNPGACNEPGPCEKCHFQIDHLPDRHSNFPARRTNAPEVPSRSLTAHVGRLEGVQTPSVRACGDCHSYQTHRPWYSHVAPLTWVITDDLNEGRRHMNFEDWEAQESPKQANDRLIDVCGEVRLRGMPPFSYRLVHLNLKLKPQEMSSICTSSQL